MGVGDQHHASATLPPAKIRYPLRRLGGPQDPVVTHIFISLRNILL